MNEQAGKEVAILGGGCFWCLEAVYLEARGVTRVESGYMGGHVDRPTYEQVCSGTTGHAEVVRVEFDPSVISKHSSEYPRPVHAGRRQALDKSAQGLFRRPDVPEGKLSTPQSVQDLQWASPAIRASQCFAALCHVSRRAVRRAPSCRSCQSSSSPATRQA